MTIAQHNGTDTGLILGSTLVTATGTELNYVDTTAGTVQASKAMVVEIVKTLLRLDCRLQIGTATMPTGII